MGAPTESSSATGVNGDQTNDDVPGSGAVYLFTRSGTTWMQQAYLKASNTGVDDRFGWVIALSNQNLAVAAFFEESNATGVDGDQANNSAPTSGAVYVY